MKPTTAIELHANFKEGMRTAVQTVEETLHNIKTHDTEIGAFLHVLNERALKKAAELDQKRKSGQPLGKLAGVPIALKDNIHIHGEISTCGSKILASYRAPFDATVTRLLETEDALIIGKTNLDEFAMGSSMENSAYHLTRNPLNPKLSPGGSSGGSATAVTAGYCPLALGSDTGGSIRQPASFCGIVGFKPTYGRISRYGLVALGSSLDQIGPFARTARDAALIMDILAKHCTHDSTSLPSPTTSHTSAFSDNLQEKTIGVPWSFLDILDPTILSTFKTTIDTLKSLGATIKEIELPILKYSIACYYILLTAEASTNLARYDGIRYGHRSEKATTLDEIYDLSREEGFGDEVKNRILLGTFVLSSGHKDAFYKKAAQVRTLFVRQFNDAFASCDLIAMPTTPKPAFPLGSIKSPLEMYLQDIFTTPANLTGHPAISIPSGHTYEDLPLSLQLIGPAQHDHHVLSAAHAYETTQGSHT